MARNEEDVLLIRHCIAREPGAWRHFVDRFAPTVRALARRFYRMHGRLPDDGELDDAVQDVFVALTARDYRLLRNYDPTYTVKTYLGVITRTEVHRELRKKRPVPGAVEDLDGAASRDGDVGDRVGDTEREEVIARALADLPARDREILRLRFFRELDYRTIAQRLDIPEASVGQTLFRAKQRLLERLKSVFGILV